MAVTVETTTNLDERRGHCAAALFEPRLDDHAAGVGLGVGLEVHDLGLEQDLAQEVVEPEALLSAHLGLGLGLGLGRTWQSAST